MKKEQSREQKKVAVYTGTRNLYPMMVPAVKSLLANSPVDEVWIFAEDDELPEKYKMPDLVHVRNVSGQKYFKSGGPNSGSGFTYMAMMRAALAKEFPKLDKILALDVDTFVIEDISEIWDIPLGTKYYLAATEETWVPDLKPHYVNIGVCLYNLKKLRGGMCTKVIEALNTKKYPFVEQDAFNELCAGAIYPLPSEYNSNRFTQGCSYPKIVHYAGRPFWHDKPQYKKYNAISWREVLDRRKEKGWPV